MSDQDRAAKLFAAALATRGFLPDDEARALARASARAAASALGPLLEVGSYLGRSALVIASGIAASRRDTVCFSLDHHRGSEELQVGWPDHDPDLVDPRSGRIDTLSRFRDRIEDADATDLVIAVVGDSPRIGRHLRGPFSLAFLDGGHGEQIAWADYRTFAPLVAPGGLLVIHDVFEDPAEGGRPPYECFRDALGSGRFIEDVPASCRSLRVLVRDDN